MTPDALFNLIITTAITIGVAGVGGFVSLIWKFNTLSESTSMALAKLSERVTRHDVMWEMVGDGALKAMHRDDDKWKMDALLDEYKRRLGELDYEQWEELRKGCEKIKNNPESSKLELFLSGFASAFAEHKLLMTRRFDLKGKP